MYIYIYLNILYKGAIGVAQFRAAQNLDLGQKSNNLAVWALFFGISRNFRYKGNQFALLENSSFRRRRHGDLKSHGATDKYQLE
jgi:hypothetical protein